MGIRSVGDPKQNYNDVWTQTGNQAGGLPAGNTWSFFLMGGGGGGRQDGSPTGPTAKAGGGGAVAGTYLVGTSDVLYCYVGNYGISNDPTNNPTVFAPKFVGGGTPGSYPGGYAGGGGGGSFVSVGALDPTTGVPIIFAAGGGGGTSHGGGGGGGAGANATPWPGFAGDGGNYEGALGGEGGGQAVGGEGGEGDGPSSTDGSDGALIEGGQGGPGSTTRGSGGGGGYYGGGGGGGANSNSGGGGGGGSNYISPVATTTFNRMTLPSSGEANTPGAHAPLPAPYQPYVNPQWHGTGAPMSLDTGSPTSPINRTGGNSFPNGWAYGGSGRIVIEDHLGNKRSLNYSGEVVQIPGSTTFDGLDFSMSFTDNTSPTADYGLESGTWGWGAKPNPGDNLGGWASSKASNANLQGTLTFTGPSRNFSEGKIWMGRNPTGTVTASVNGGSPFPLSATGGSGALAENDLGPRFPGEEAIDTISIILTGGSNNSSYKIGRLEINGVVVTFGQNWI